MLLRQTEHGTMRIKKKKRKAGSDAMLRMSSLVWGQFEACTSVVHESACVLYALPGGEPLLRVTTKKAVYFSIILL